MKGEILLRRRQPRCSTLNRQANSFACLFVDLILPTRGLPFTFAFEGFDTPQISRICQFFEPPIAAPQDFSPKSVTMSESTDEHSYAKKSPNLGKRLWQLVSIFMILLTPWVFYRDLKEAYKTGAEQEKAPKNKSFTAKLETAVQAQLAVLQGVDSEALGQTYFTALQSTECNWVFQCHPIRVAESPNPLSSPILPLNLSPEVASALEKGRQMALAPINAAPAATPPALPSTVTLPPSVKFHEMKGSAQPLGSNSPDLSSPFTHASGSPGLSHNGRSTITAIDTVATAPAAFTRLGPIWLPTLHAIRGTPHALWQMVIAIHDAGIWAIAMYLSCTLIWITLWLRKLPMMLYLLVLGGPLSIPLIVTLMQWLCEGLLKLGLAGCAVAAGLMALLPSTALALLVGLHHAVKSPRELVEAVEHLKG